MQLDFSSHEIDPALWGVVIKKRNVIKKRTWCHGWTGKSVIIFCLVYMNVTEIKLIDNDLG